MQQWLLLIVYGLSPFCYQAISYNSAIFFSLVSPLRSHQRIVGATAIIAAYDRDGRGDDPGRGQWLRGGHPDYLWVSTPKSLMFLELVCLVNKLLLLLLAPLLLLLLLLLVMHKYIHGSRWWQLCKDDLWMNHFNISSLIQLLKNIKISFR